MAADCHHCHHSGHTRHAEVQLHESRTAQGLRSPALMVQWQQSYPPSPLASYHLYLSVYLGPACGLRPPSYLRPSTIWYAYHGSN